MDAGTHDRRAGPSGFGRVPLGSLDLGVFAGVFLFRYVSAIGLAWLYAHRGNRLHVSLMAALTAVAFLLRHDHGVYIGFMMVCFLGLREWGGAQLWRRLGLYTGVTAGLVLPFLVFVQTTTGLVSYVVGSEPQSQTTSLFQASLPIVPLPFEVDRSAPLWVVAPPGERRVNVRWAEGATDTARRDQEVRFGLTAGARAEGRTWSYILTDHESANVRALVLNPMVEDTAGIDRGRFRVVPERWDSWLTRKLFVLRLSLVPGVFTAQNALAWFYYLTILVPVIALGWVGAAWWSGRVARPEASVVAAAAILCCIISHTLIRESPDSRLAEVAPPTFVLAAWLARRRGADDPGGFAYPCATRTHWDSQPVPGHILECVGVRRHRYDGRSRRTDSECRFLGRANRRLGTARRRESRAARSSNRLVGPAGEHRPARAHPLRARLHGAVGPGPRDLVLTGRVLLRRTGVRRWPGLL